MSSGLRGRTFFYTMPESGGGIQLTTELQYTFQPGCKDTRWWREVFRTGFGEIPGPRGAKSSPSHSCRSVIAPIQVIVLDANDNQPVFNQSIYKTYVVENVQEGTLVIRLLETDKGEGANSVFKLLLRGSI
ncbi:unnamed protein product [Caretta caretta]